MKKVKENIFTAWTREELESVDYPEEWYKNIFNFTPVEHHPDMLLFWVSGSEAVATVDNLSDHEIIDRSCQLLRQFTGDPSLPPPDHVFR